ncbi:RHS repeat domain-containing protein [Streptomyces brasiliensis]|uniref:Type IV secretion protein Rhs n=1 Tax=Streptomyces brasiliensis TaxID=1954 RepID=A0A917P1K8_9ACTN|nr:hypothetical protein GCM10010121_073940 [Streptomyces brasiliensis]
MVGYRPADWHPLDLDRDPTPGDPDRVRSLATQLHDFAHDVSEALRLVKGMAGEDTLLEWAGKSAEVFKEQFGDVPKNLKKLKTSYEMCGDALADFWPKLERAQALADRALAKAKEAQDDLTSAKSRPSSADSWVNRANKEADKYTDDPTGRKSDGDKPDEAKVRAATRDVQNAKSAHSKDIWRYTWDADDRLTSVVTPDGTLWRYLYDPLGRRVAKRRMAADGQGIAEETRFTWDGAHLVEQTTVRADSSETSTLTWERDGTRPLAQTERITLADAPQEVVDERFYAMVTDLVGTPTELVSEGGDVVWRADATLWGVPGPQESLDTSTPLRFPGQYFDPETQLHHNFFRYYDPVAAAYISADPLGLDAGPNPCAYVPNPLSWLDYLGLLTCAENADLLAKNLAREGRAKSAGEAAAHIVPSGMKRNGAAQARALLEKYGVDINDAANGIPLGHPRPHNFTHRKMFLTRVNAHLNMTVDSMTAAGYGARAIRGALRQELRSIGRQVESELAGGQPAVNAIWTAP